MSKQAPEQWLWLVIMGAFGAFGFGYGTGSNDVANAFGTSIGSGALNNRQAVLIAGTMEFTGALVLGRVSVSVISGNIADRTAFAACPACYAYGMMWTLWVGTIWLLTTTYFGINVSSTHSIIGGILGFALAYKSSAVLWITDSPNTAFPPVAGIVPIVVTWVFAPCATGFAAAILFLIIRTIVLRSSDSYSRSFYLLPIFLALVTWVNIYFVFTKGAKKTFASSPGTKDDWNDDKAAWIAACVAAGVSVLSIPFLPLVKRRADQLEKMEADAEEAKLGAHLVLVEDMEKRVKTQFGVSRDDDTIYRTSLGIFISEMKHINNFQSLKDALNKANDGAKEATAEFYAGANETVSSLRHHAEKFDRKTESVFKVLQVFSACAVMFAHGAGEVGYMAGPLATIWEVHITNGLKSSVVAPTWILVLSALSLVIGLATYGQKVTKGVGKDLAVVTASRGFCAELCTSIVIMVAAQFGLPTSSSQCITGGVVGIGLVEGAATGVNWKFLAETVSSWVITLFVVGFGTAALFGQGHASP